MDTDSPIPDRRATRWAVERLHAQGLLGAEARDRAWTLLVPPVSSQEWLTWVNRLLLFLGAALVLAGIVFFFAYNWASMGPALKFTLIEAALLLTLLGTWWKGLDSLTGKTLLLCASVLVGVLLAVYGQVYQTGADPFELFRGWFLLIAGWVIISRFAAHWLLWLILVNLCLILYFEQVVFPNKEAEQAELYIYLGLINSCALVLHEMGVKRGFSWLKVPWLRWALLAFVLAFQVIPTFMMIVESSERHLAGVLSLIFWLLVTVGAFAYFRWKVPDLLSLTFCVLGICVVVLAFMGKVVFEISDEAGAFLLFGLLVVAVFGLAALVLIKTWKVLAVKGGADG